MVLPMEGPQSNSSDFVEEGCNQLIALHMVLAIIKVDIIVVFAKATCIPKLGLC